MKQPATTMTYEEFLEWADEDTLAEWVDGEVIMASPPGYRHQDIADFLVTVLRTFVEVHGLGIILSAPFQMKVGRSGREPDLLFVANAHRASLKPTFLDGPADLAVEIVSPESVERDRITTFAEYEQAGVQEFWLLDPQQEQAEFYQLNAEGVYQLAPPDSDGIYRSSVVMGFWLRKAWLWQQPLPEVEDVLLEVGGEPYARRLIERLRQRGFLPDA